MAASDARPIPRKNTAYRVTFPILDNDGDLVTGAASLDSEVSKDGGAFADATSEATEIATNSGMYYLDLTADEMNADTVAVIVKTSTSNAKTTPIVMYPEEAGDIRVDVVQISGDSGAADNLEAILDGTGGVTLVASAFTLTTPINADMVKISTDSGAADNLEAILDGTGGTGIKVSTLQATGAVAFDSTFTVTGATTLTGAVSLGSTLGVTGTTTLAAVNTGAVGVTTFAASGTVTFNALTITNNLGVGGTWTVTGATTLTGAVTATNASNDIRGIQVNSFSTAGKAEVQTEANDALVANNLDHLLLSAVDTDLATTMHANSVVGYIMVKSALANYVRTTDSLEALYDGIVASADVVTIEADNVTISDE